MAEAEDGVPPAFPWRSALELAVLAPGELSPRSRAQLDRVLCGLDPGTVDPRTAAWIHAYLALAPPGSGVRERSGPVALADALAPVVEKLGEGLPASLPDWPGAGGMPPARAPEGPARRGRREPGRGLPVLAWLATTILVLAVPLAVMEPGPAGSEATRVAAFADEGRPPETLARTGPGTVLPSPTPPPAAASPVDPTPIAPPPATPDPPPRLPAPDRAETGERDRLLRELAALTPSPEGLTPERRSELVATRTDRSSFHPRRMWAEVWIEDQARRGLALPRNPAGRGPREQAEYLKSLFYVNQVRAMEQLDELLARLAASEPARR